MLLFQTLNPERSKTMFNCPGCQVDLTVANVGLPVVVIGGQLATKCPLCNYVQYIRLVDDGPLVKVEVIE
jgi:hypothetical protein